MAALSIRERLALAGIAVLGKSYMSDAYLMTHETDTSKVKPESIYKMASRWINSDEAKLFRKELAARMGAATEDDAALMGDKEILAELTKAARLESDTAKRAQILLSITKVKDRLAPDEQERQHVVMYLPFNSDCRQCELFLAEKQRKQQENENK